MVNWEMSSVIITRAIQEITFFFFFFNNGGYLFSGVKNTNLAGNKATSNNNNDAEKFVFYGFGPGSLAGALRLLRIPTPGHPTRCHRMVTIWYTGTNGTLVQRRGLGGASGLHTLSMGCLKMENGTYCLLYGSNHWMTMSDVIRNILASALVENSTDLKCLEPYIHTKQTELGVGSDRSALREKRRGKLEAMRKSFGQFSMEKLHGFNDGDLMCRPAAGALRPKNVPRGSSTVAVEHPKRKETFCECGAHDQRTITKSWKARLKEIEDDILLNLRSPVFFAPQHLLRNDLLCSSNLNTVLLNRTVLVWFPHAITTACTLESMSCWTEGCVGGNISMCRINQRIVEGVRSLEFILYAEYRCSKCHRDKSSLDGLALTTMGVPCSIIKQCPVVEFNDSLIKNATDSSRFQ